MRSVSCSRRRKLTVLLTPDIAFSSNHVDSIEYVILPQQNQVVLFTHHFEIISFTSIPIANRNITTIPTITSGCIFYSFSFIKRFLYMIFRHLYSTMRSIIATIRINTLAPSGVSEGSIIVV